jgi:hypothetical protein
MRNVCMTCNAYWNSQNFKYCHESYSLLRSVTSINSHRQLQSMRTICIRMPAQGQTKILKLSTSTQTQMRRLHVRHARNGRQKGWFMLSTTTQTHMGGGGITYDMPAQASAQNDRSRDLIEASLRPPAFDTKSFKFPFSQYLM